MKSIIIEGTQMEAACESCRKFTLSTYAYGSFPTEDGQIVEDVMRATCNTCGEITALSHQSAHRLKAAREERQQKRTSLRLPMELYDFISLSLSRVGADLTHVELYFRSLLLACRGKEEVIGKKLKLTSSDVLSRPNRVTVNLTLGTHLLVVLENLRRASEIQSHSELIRRLLVLADGPLGKTIQIETERLAYAYA
jgi:hypothetical protein